MARIAFTSQTFQPKTLAIIERADAICAEYAAQGLRMTLRQLYYQFVARGMLANEPANYDRLGSIVNDARLAGLLDWNYIVDRTRELESLPRWKNPSDFLQAAANQFRIDKWARQPWRPEVWIEKEALAGVIEPVCRELDVAFMAVRGYNSQSAHYEAALRFARYRKAGQEPVLFHLGDHDPSGIDMTRDNRDRLVLFLGQSVEVRRLALNMDQIERYNPPPNPAKWSDSRASGYVERFGEESWELDALEPTVLADLIRRAVLDVRDENLWSAAVAEEDEQRAPIIQVADQWDDVKEYLS